MAHWSSDGVRGDGLVDLVLLVWFGRFGFSNGVQLKKIAGVGGWPTGRQMV